MPDCDRRWSNQACNYSDRSAIKRPPPLLRFLSVAVQEEIIDGWIFLSSYNTRVYTYCIIITHKKKKRSMEDERTDMFPFVVVSVGYMEKRKKEKREKTFSVLFYLLHLGAIQKPRPRCGSIDHTVEKLFWSAPKLLFYPRTLKQSNRRRHTFLYEMEGSLHVLLMPWNKIERGGRRPSGSISCWHVDRCATGK